MNIGVARHVLLELNAHSTILELTICVWVSKSKTSVTVSVQCISIKMKGARKPHQGKNTRQQTPTNTAPQLAELRQKGCAIIYLKVCSFHP